ncbi:MAG: hypothetical protein ACTHJ3_03695 [Pararhizobium sp.]
MSTNRNALIGEAALAFTATLWLGLLLGVSFLATPVKFAAPTLILPVALDVGRVTFALLTKVEWAMAVLTAGSMLLAGLRRLPAILLALLIALLALQSLWLLPILDLRIAAVIAGTPLPPTSHHLVYIAIESGKAALLLSLAFLALRALARSSTEGERTMPRTGRSARTASAPSLKAQL